MNIDARQRKMRVIKCFFKQEAKNILGMQRMAHILLLSYFLLYVILRRVPALIIIIIRFLKKILRATTVLKKQSPQIDHRPQTTGNDYKRCCYP